MSISNRTWSVSIWRFWELWILQILEESLLCLLCLWRGIVGEACNEMLWWSCIDCSQLDHKSHIGRSMTLRAQENAMTNQLVWRYCIRLFGSTNIVKFLLISFRPTAAVSIAITIASMYFWFDRLNWIEDAKNWLCCRYSVIIIICGKLGPTTIRILRVFRANFSPRESIISQQILNEFPYNFHKTCGVLLHKNVEGFAAIGLGFEIFYLNF